MEQRTAHRRWMAAAVAATLWLASGLISSAFIWNDILSGSIRGVLPATIAGSVWYRPTLWTLVVAVVGAAGIMLLHHAITRIVLATDSRSVAFVVSWFAAIVAGAVIGLGSDIATIVASLPPARLQWLLDGLGNQAAVGGYWGLVQGWIPALLVAFATSRAAASTNEVSGKRTPSHAGRVITAATLVVAVAAVAAVGVGSQRAARVADAQESAIANGFDPNSGALPDPYAEGTPVATVAPNAPDRDPAWCTPEQAMVLLGEADTATGHRSQAIELLNFSDTACIAEGYLDVAFVDQNGHALKVDVVHGSSFMAIDPGSKPVEVPAGRSAIAYLGWDANSTADALVATTLYAAAFAGDTRGSWPVQTDIIDGSTVEVTAWKLSQDGDSSAG